MSTPWKVGVAVGTACIAIGAIAGGTILLTDSDEDSANAPVDTTTTTVARVTTSTAPITEASSAVWPLGSSRTRYADPVAAATGFAAEFLGFASPVVGEFRQGDARSGEVDVQASDGRPVTTVLVRQLGPDDSWWAIGASTANIHVSAPSALARVASPATLDGMSTAFEATVQVEIRDDADAAPIGSGFVMGGANGELGPFHGTLTFSPPSSPFGTIVFFTTSAENGQRVEATVIRVQFA